VEQARKALCDQKNIQGLPQLEINGRWIEGVKPLARLG